MSADDEYEGITLYGGPANRTIVNIARGLIGRIDLPSVLRNWGPNRHVGINYTYLVERCECGKRFGIYDEVKGEVK